ncbi:unnamed protein product [Coccothraustes coccothraustes]
MCFVPGTTRGRAGAGHGSAHGGTPRAAGEGAQGGSLGSPEHGEREGNAAHPSGARATAVPRESRGPASQGSPRTRGSLARPLLGERPSTAQGDRTELPRRPARLRPAGTRRYRDAATVGHGASGTREERAPSPERGGAPAANTRREQDGGRRRKERRTEKGSAAPRDGASPPADRRARPPHLHRGGGLLARKGCWEL